MAATGDQVTRTGMVQSVRQRFTIAQVNAGATVVAAVGGFIHRAISIKMIAIGGAAGSTTTVDVLGTRSAGSVKLYAANQGGLTEDAVLGDEDSNMTVLAAGATYTPLDVNTPITIGKTGSDVDTATDIDVVLTYASEPAVTQ